MAEGRIPPHSDDVERSVLGAFLIDREAIIEVAEFLRPEHFYDESHRRIYRSALDLYESGKPIDLVTISERLRQQKNLAKIGGSSYLAQLAAAVPTASNVEQYGQIVRDLATKRELINVAGKLA